MKLSNWHILERKNTKERHIIYGPIDEWSEETDNNINDFTEIPTEKWTTNEIVEISGNLLEDVNLHRCCNAPNDIQDIMTISGISDEEQHRFFMNYMNLLFDRYSY